MVHLSNYKKNTVISNIVKSKVTKDTGQEIKFNFHDIPCTILKILAYCRNYFISLVRAQGLKS